MSGARREPRPRGTGQAGSRAQQAAGCPAHSPHPALAPRLPASSRSSHPRPTHSKPAARARHPQRRGRRHGCPHGAMLLETTPWGTQACRARRQRGRSALCPGQVVAHGRSSQGSRWLGWRAGQRCQGLGMASSLCPGTTPACPPSLPGTAPVPVDFALPHPCPRRAAAAPKHEVSASTPRSALAGTGVPGSSPADSTWGAMQPHGADSSSWVASPVIDVLSAAQQLSWFRVNCARNHPTQKGWGSPAALASTFVGCAATRAGGSGRKLSPGTTLSARCCPAPV